MLQGQFTLKDFYEQLSMIQKMGSLKDIIAKLPMQNLIPKEAVVDDKELVRIKAMIDSMTVEERQNPKVFNESRVRRVAKGSGHVPKDVAELLKRFMGMRKMMGMMGKNMGLLSKIPGLGQMAQLGKLKQMAGAGGGLPGMGGMPGGMGGMPGGLGGLANMMGGMGGMGGGAPKRPIDKDKKRKDRKAAQKARKKNRRK